METYPIVLGTAGHIDHGKTALVRALTGIDTDRLKVEKERGITIELGFAHLDLDGRRFGVVDVPGHERFIKAMVAGAGGLDLVCLVIAADEGIMPQTREHLDICQLLNVRRGVVALTKSDLVDDEWVQLVSEEIRAGLAGRFLEHAKIIPVSAKTGAGLDDLRGELLRLTDDLPARPSDGAFRLPLDRVFTIRGFGTVVTGTIVGGTVAIGDAVVALPRGIAGKVRGVEVHGEAVQTACAGMRCALNISGVSRDDVERGDVLAHEAGITPSHILDARFRYLSTSKSPLPHRTRILFHHTTTQVMATLVLVDATVLHPGDEALVQIRVDVTTPVAALPGDHFIARGFVLQEHYGTTIGGGEIVRVQAPKARKSATAAQEALARIAEARDDERIALEVKATAAAGIDVGELGRRLGHSHNALNAALTRLSELGDVIDAAGTYCHAEPFAMLEKRALEIVDEARRAAPEKTGMSRQELRAKLPSALVAKMFDTLIRALVRREALEADADTVRRPRGASKVDLSPMERTIAARFREWGMTPDRPKLVADVVGADAKTAKAAMDKLLSSGVLVRVKSDLYYDAHTVGEVRAKLEAHLEQHGQITPPEWKELTGVSRKFAIPLAEYFDDIKLTLRVGDLRKRR